MKKNFENNEALNGLFEGFKSVEEIEKEKLEEKKEQPKKETKKETKKNEPEKKTTLFTEIDSVIAEYLDLMTFITGQTKRDYINELLKAEIKKNLNVAEDGTDIQIHRAIENKKKELQKLFRKPSK